MFRGRTNLALAALLGIGTSLFAQTFRGGIAGNVLDASGAAVPQAAVKVIHQGTGLTRNLMSSAAGDFAIPQLPPGMYDVSIRKQSFQTRSITNVEVTAGKVTSLPITLALAQRAEVIEVTGEIVALDTTQTALNSELPTKAVQEIPLNGRNFTQLLRLTPGFNVDGSMNGNRGDQNNWQIDGADNNDFWLNGSAINQGALTPIAAALLPIEAIDQINHQAAGGVDFGRNPGSLVNVVLKSGTNQAHGSAFYFQRNDYLAASSPFSYVDSPSKLRDHNFGASLGGPIVKNKAFYFLTYEGQRYINGSPQQVTAPSEAWVERARTVLQAYGVPENPVMDRVLTLWTQKGQNAPATSANFFTNDNTVHNSDNAVAKIDYILNPKHSMSFRSFDGTGQEIITPTAQYGQYAPATYSEYFLVVPSHIHNYALSWTGVFSPRVVNQVLAAANYFKQRFDTSDHGANMQALGFNTGVTNPADFGTPYMSIEDFAPVGSGGPVGRIDATGHITDNLSYIAGAHAFTLGGEFRRSRMDVSYQRGGRGSFFWNGSAGPWSDDSRYLDGEKALADFLAGFIGPQQAFITVGDPQRVYEVNSSSWWAQDNWRASAQLNVNLGLRYEYNGPLHDTKNSVSTFLPSAPGGLAFPGQSGSPIQTLNPRDLNNFAPRIGLVFTPRRDGRTVIRAAYGLYYDVADGSSFIDSNRSGVSENPAGPHPVFGLTAGGPGFVVQQGVPIFGGVQPTPPFGVFGVNQNLRSPYVHEFNVNVQRQLGKSAYFQAGYVGNQGRKLLITRNINQPPPDSTGTLSMDERRPYYAQFPQFSSITEVSSAGDSQYNAFQLSMHAMSWHGLTGRFAYTLGHSRDDMSGARNSLPTDNYDLRRDYSNSDFDTRHNVSGYLVYELPRLGVGRPRLSRGWQLSAFFSHDSGFPFSVNAGQDISNTGNGNDKADLVGDPFSGVPAPVRGPGGRIADLGYPWFNPAAFALPAPGTFGTSKRNQFYGAGFNSMDFSLSKNTPVTERIITQFRFEVFNLFNNLNLSWPENWLEADTNMGRIYGTRNSSTPGIGPGEAINAQVGFKLIW